MRVLGTMAAMAVCTSVFAQGYDRANFQNLSWENVGPNRGGRSVACTGVRKRPAQFYFGACGGGLWKTNDSGALWTCVTDGFLKSSSVGAVAVSESNPDVVYLGTGERDIRGDISEGDGVYKSIDAGKTWTHVGLEATRTVSRIVIDPKNPDIVYVAALGHVYGSGLDRGVYKSVDGGKTWSKILFQSDRAGAVDLQMDPTNSNVLYASTWEAWRTPYFLNSGGDGSRIFKSVNAGRTWMDITRNSGLPSGTIGKVCLSVCAANPKRVWASVEAKEGGVYRSDDAGATWAKVSSNSNYTQRAWYFSHVIADPKASDTVYDLNVSAFRSVDAGKTWSRLSTSHGDNHDLWIDPDDSNRMIESNDGGASVSLDGGKTWSKETFATAQFYHVVADNHIPYRIYGCQQDNSAVVLTPGERGGPDRPNWENSAGGEAGYMAVNAKNPDLVYGGNYNGYLEELDTRTDQSRDINPWPENPMGHAASDLKHRIQWTFPIVFSPTDPNVLYTASQYLLRTTNRGQSWQQISPDLTRNDPDKQRSSGGPITQDNTSIEYYDTIFTVAESPRDRKLIWVGSDDGMVHITRNGGADWQDVTPPELPKWARISMIEASPHSAGTAYLAANNYQNDDTAPYIFRTHDYGQTWTRIVKGIPVDSFARVCREDRRRPGLLFAGTETGVFVSFDDGDQWQSLNANMPLCPVHDLCLKDDDLIAATHGRSFWVMHRISALEELTASKPTSPLLYSPIDRVRQTPPTVVIDYYLPTAAKQVSLQVVGPNGETYASSFNPKTEPGVHSFAVTLNHRGFEGFPGMVLWSGFSRPIPAPPGKYRVTLTVDGKSQSVTARLLKDPRLAASERDLQEQYEISVKISERITEANQAVVRIRDEKQQIAKVVTDSKNDAEVARAASALTDDLTAVEGEIYQYRSKSGEDPLNYPVKLNDQLAGVLGVAQSGQSRVPEQVKQVYRILDARLQVQLNRLKAIETGRLAAFNAVLKAKGLTAIAPKNPPLTSGGRPRGGGDDDQDGDDDRDE
jgi:photosystem II stability/assembly factor-like uncharacterized protein